MGIWVRSPNVPFLLLYKSNSLLFSCVVFVEEHNLEADSGPEALTDLASVASKYIWQVEARLEGEGRHCAHRRGRSAGLIWQLTMLPTCLVEAQWVKLSLLRAVAQSSSLGSRHLGKPVREGPRESWWTRSSRLVGLLLSLNIRRRNLNPTSKAAALPLPLTVYGHLELAPGNCSPRNLAPHH